MRYKYGITVDERFQRSIEANSADNVLKFNRTHLEEECLFDTNFIKNLQIVIHMKCLERHPAINF
jgi:hypothetical protein